MLQISIDEKQAKELILQKVSELIKEVDAEMVFWDSNELKRRTCMSWETIQNTFFYDQRFPKFKIGGKWYYPARDVRSFLENWIVEQGSAS